MSAGTILSFVPLLIGLFAVQPGAIQQSVTRLVEQDEVILRIPIQPRPLVRVVEWQERRGPNCVASGAIQRAFLSGTEQVDFILANHRRLRAELEENCPALDFYRGFYLQLPDGRLCAGRDAIHSRMGGSCGIERFKLLVPKFRR